MDGSPHLHFSLFSKFAIANLKLGGLYGFCIITLSKSIELTDGLFFME